MLKMKTLRLSKKVYQEDSIRLTITAYQNYAQFSIKEFPDAWEIVFSDCKFDEDRTVKEFENYLIGIENR